jgi:transposase
MTLLPVKIESVLGIDVSKDTVSLFDSATERTDTIANTTRALTAALKPFAGCRLAVCETTGGYEDKLLAVLHKLGLPAHRADGARVKAFIRSFGNLAKTDAIDAAWLARYGRERGDTLVRWQPPTPNQLKIEALVARRLDLVEIRVKESNRLAAPRSKPIAADLRSHIRELDRRIQALEARIDALIASCKAMELRTKVLRSIPGVGRVLAPLLLAMMPELGSLSRRQAASLAGCAPHPNDSGKTNGYRATRGGRRQLRPALFIAAMAATRGQNPVAAAYRALLKNGKPKRLALVATMRRIVTIANARLRDVQMGPIQLTSN